MKISFAVSQNLTTGVILIQQSAVNVKSAAGIEQDECAKISSELPQKRPTIQIQWQNPSQYL
jgi:hypothetical protein